MIPTSADRKPSVNPAVDRADADRDDHRPDRQEAAGAVALLALLVNRGRRR